MSQTAPSELSIAALDNRACVAVSGEDARTFLQGLVTCDMTAVVDGKAAFGSLLTPQGKILHELFIVGHKGAFLIDCPKHSLADLLKRLTLYKLRAKVSIEDVTSRFQPMAAWGGDASVQTQAGAAGDAVVYADPRMSEMGHRLFEAAGGIEPNASRTTYDERRISFGIPELGSDYEPGAYFPHDVGLDLLHGVAFKKGCYVGQEVVSRMHHRGTGRTRVVCVKAPSALPPPNTDVLADDFPIGKMGSSQGENGIAIVRLDRLSEALAAKQALIAGGVALSFRAPPWATYQIMPQDSTA